MWLELKEEMVMFSYASNTFSFTSVKTCLSGLQFICWYCYVSHLIRESFSDASFHPRQTRHNALWTTHCVLLLCFSCKSSSQHCKPCGWRCNTTGSCRVSFWLGVNFPWKLAVSRWLNGLFAASSRTDYFDLERPNYFIRHNDILYLSIWPNDAEIQAV